MVGTMAPMKLTLCLVNRNGVRHLPASLPRIVACREHLDEAILADDASTDASVAEVRAALPDVRVVALDRNRGPGAARNAGLAAARHDRILFVDNDVQLEKDAIVGLMAALDERPRAVVAVPRVLHASASERIQFEGADAHFLGLQRLACAERAAADCATETSLRTSLVTACFLLDRARWRAHGSPGLFDESFFFNYEDHDLGLRISLLGGEILSVPRAHVLHGTGTEGLSFRAGSPYPTERVRFLIRNRWQILFKNFEARTLRACAPALALYEVLQLAAAMRRGWLGAWIAALGDLRRGRLRLLAERRVIQAARRVPDHAILCGGPAPFSAGLAHSRFERRAQASFDRFGDAVWKRARRRAARAG